MPARKIRTFRKGSEESQCLSIFDAFGSTSYSYRSPIFPLTVFEEMHNGKMRRFLVPTSRSQEGRWVLWCRRVHVFMGHSFLQQRANYGPFLIACLPCLAATSVLQQDHYKCRDCHMECFYLNYEEVKEPCPVSSILRTEIEFPYDFAQETTGWRRALLNDLDIGE